MFYLHLLGLVVTILVSIGTALWVRRQTRDRAGTVMIVLLLVHAAMALLVLGQLLSRTVDGKVLLFHLWYSLVAISPVLWFVLALYYTGRAGWITRSVKGLLVCSILGTTALLLTNPVHELLVTEFRLVTDPFSHMEVTPTAISDALLGVMYLYMLVAVGLFFRTFLAARRSARVQIAAFLVGLFVIMAPAVASYLKVVPVVGFPYGVLGAGVFGVIVAVSLFRTRLFAVAPLARDAVFESIEDAIVVVDADLTIADFNDAAVDLFPDIARQIDESIADAYPVLLPRDSASIDGGLDDTPAVRIGDRQTPTVTDRRDESTETPFAERIEVSSVDSERTRALRVGASAITIGRDTRGYVLILRDVTDLETYTADLEHKTDQLERFASVLSHDLRNPVSIASGYVELARETGDLEHLEDVTIALERMDETIEDLLTLSREGDAIDETDAVTLRSLVADAWTTSDTQTLTLENEIDPEYRIRTDPSRLRTLLENLFRNAADHGAETVRVEGVGMGGKAESETETESGFTVSDDGPGIPEGKREQVLEYGYSSADGTGIGLAIVSSVVAAHGWSLSVGESDQGGARFTVSGVERVQSRDTTSVPNDD